MPDVFVPMDTTRASRFFIDCNRKATQMRFASRVFDRNIGRLSSIDNYADMDAFFASASLEENFRRFARSEDGITATDEEYMETLPYLLPQLKALVGRYSKLGENAFYKYYLPVDTTVEAALEAIGAPPTGK